MVINDYISDRCGAVEAINTKSSEKSFTNYNPSFCVCMFVQVHVNILLYSY